MLDNLIVNRPHKPTNRNWDVNGLILIEEISKLNCAGRVDFVQDHHNAWLEYDRNGEFLNFEELEN